MSCCVFFRRCSLCRGLANAAMHLTRPLQFPAAQRDTEPAAFWGQVMASVSQSISHNVVICILENAQRSKWVQKNLLLYLHSFHGNGWRTSQCMLGNGKANAESLNPPFQPVLLSKETAHSQARFGIISTT